MNYSLNGWFYQNLNSRSPSWTGVNEFWNFGTENEGIGLKISPCDIKDLEICDVIQLFNGERFFHTLIVTDIKDGEILVAAHDNPAFDTPLLSYGFSNLRCGKVSS